MEIKFYNKKDSNNQLLISKLKKFDDDIFGVGPNIVNITEEDIKDVLTGGFVFALTDNNELLAIILFKKKEGFWYCKGVCTHQNYQGRGLSDLLLKKSLQHLNKEYITATVRENNIPSLKLFVKKNGFIVTKYLKDHFGIGKDRLYMESGPKIEMLKKNLTDEKLELDCNDKDKIKKALDSGFVVVTIEGNNLIFLKKKTIN